MAVNITNKYPTPSTNIVAGDYIAFDIDYTGASEVVLMVGATTIWSYTGGDTPGFTLDKNSVTASAASFASITKDAGWNGTPIQFTVTVTGGSYAGTESWSYTVGQQAAFPDGVQPYNPTYDTTRDTDAVHVDVPNEFVKIGEVTIAAGDRVLIEDSSDDYNKKWADLTYYSAPTFLGLPDVDPATYTGQADKLVTVNGTEDGVDFSTVNDLTLTNPTDSDKFLFADASASYAHKKADASYLAQGVTYQYFTGGGGPTSGRFTHNGAADSFAGITSIRFHDVAYTVGGVASIIGSLSAGVKILIARTYANSSGGYGIYTVVSVVDNGSDHTVTVTTDESSGTATNGDIYNVVIVGGSGGGGGGGTWGSITGTLTDQADLDDWLNRQGGVGTVSGGTVTDGGSGTINISAWTGYLRTSDTDTADLRYYSIGAGTGVALTDNALNFVYADYNGGSPQFSVYLTPQRTDRTQTVLGAVYRAGTTLHITDGDWDCGNTGATVGTRDALVNGIQYESGAVVTEDGVTAKALEVTAGQFWVGLHNITTPAYDGGTPTNFAGYYYRDGIGGWSTVTPTNLINVTQYDDNSGTLQALGANRYGVHWVYVGMDGDVYVVFGRDNYLLAGAQAATPPADLPPHFNAFHTILRAKVIISEATAGIHSIEAPQTQSFGFAAATDHGNLGGLADDDHTQYSLVTGTRAFTGTVTTNLNYVTTGAGTNGLQNTTAGAPLYNTTADNASGNAGSIVLDVGNSTGSNGNGGSVYIYPGKPNGTGVGGGVYIGDSGFFGEQGSLSLYERAAANADTAGYGQFWVKTATPNEPWFTDDAGNDKCLTSKVHTLVTNEVVNVDTTEVIVGGFYFDAGFAGTTHTFEVVAKLIDGGAGAPTDVQVRLYDMGPDGTPTAGTLRSTITCTSTSIDYLSQTLTSNATPGTNQLQNAARLYEVRLYLNATGGVHSGLVYNARIVERG